MARREVHLELLLGKKVLDQTGKVVGRIEEVRAEQQGDECVVQDYLIGAEALLERLSAWNIALAALRLFGAHKIESGYIVPWDQLDLTDPERPRLRCDLDQLEPISDQS